MKKVKATKFPKSPELFDSKQFGLAVRAGRTNAGMTLEDAALTIGMAKQTLSDIELGKPTVGLGNALLAATSLGVAVFIVPADERESTKFKLSKP
jgi:transcriptional regulator with XRE-family HTH domain